MDEVRQQALHVRLSAWPVSVGGVVRDRRTHRAAALAHAAGHSRQHLSAHIGEKGGPFHRGLYAMLGERDNARLDMIPNEPHGLTKPFREAISRWMKLHVAGTGDGKPVSEGEVTPLPVNDPRLLCDPEGKLLTGVPSIVELPARRADDVRKRTRAKEDVLDYVKLLVAPGESESDLQRVRTFETSKIAGGTREKVLFLSEIGEYIPALLWRPDAARPRVVLIADAKGKAALDEQRLVKPLLDAGYAVLAVDLRGRGETLETRANGRDNNYHYVSHSIMWGQPLAGRRAFDVSRAVDYVESRKDLSADGLIAIGVGAEELIQSAMQNGAVHAARASCRSPPAWIAPRLKAAGELARAPSGFGSQRQGT